MTQQHSQGMVGGESAALRHRHTRISQEYAKPQGQFLLGQGSRTQPYQEYQGDAGEEEGAGNSVYDTQ